MQPKPADSVSGAITETNLAKQTLDTADLPSLGTPPAGTGSLEELLKIVNASKNVMRAGGFEEEKKAKSREIIAALHGAAGSDLPAGAFDAKIPPKYFESSDLRNDLEALGKAIRTRVNEHIENAEFDEAQGIAVSYLVLGQKIFETNTRLKPRQRGLAMMKGALSTMRRINQARFEDGEIDQDERNQLNEQVAKWSTEIGRFENVWNSKLKAIEAVTDVNVADIVKVAEEDEDVTFRAFAALRLGYAFFERGDQGNQAAIKSAIESLKSDSNPLVAKAAKEADSIEREEYYELRK